MLYHLSPEILSRVGIDIFDARTSLFACSGQCERDKSFSYWKALPIIRVGVAHQLIRGRSITALIRKISEAVVRKRRQTVSVRAAFKSFFWDSNLAGVSQICRLTLKERIKSFWDSGAKNGLLTLLELVKLATKDSNH